MWSMLILLGLLGHVNTLIALNLPTGFCTSMTVACAASLMCLLAISSCSRPPLLRKGRIAVLLSNCNTEEPENCMRQRESGECSFAWMLQGFLPEKNKNIYAVTPLLCVVCVSALFRIMLINM